MNRRATFGSPAGTCGPEEEKQRLLPDLRTGKKPHDYIRTFGQVCVAEWRVREAADLGDYSAFSGARDDGDEG